MPSASSCFLHVFCFAEKPYQTKSKHDETFYDDFLWKIRDPRKLREDQPEELAEGPTSQGGAPPRGARRPRLVGPLVAPFDVIPTLKIPIN